MRKIITSTILIVLTSSNLVAQNVGIGTNTPNASAKLEITSTNSGLLIPRVALTTTSAAGPVTTPATSLLVYNTATVADVTPGYYYWTGTSWTRLLNTTSADWTLLGNAGTNAGTNFIGTTDAVDLVTRTNNTERMRVLAGGGIVVTSPNFNANALNPAIDVQGAWIRLGDASGNQTFTNGMGIKFHDAGLSHASMQYLSSTNFINFGISAGNGNSLLLDIPASPALAIDLSNRRIGIGTNSPAEAIHAIGNIRSSTLAGVGSRLVASDANGTLTNVAAGTNGQVLTMVAGNPSWAASSGGWGLTGNAGTVAGTNFIGTTDNVQFQIRVNNQQAGLISGSAGTTTFFGFNAGLANTAANTTAFGHRALDANTTGANNVGFGKDALGANTTGSDNVFIGTSAGDVNTAGIGNIGMGTDAMGASTSGQWNIAVGHQTLSGTTGTFGTIAIGYQANTSANSSNYSIGIGYQAMQLQTGGGNSIAIGYQALRNNNANQENIAIGQSAMTNNTNGKFNTAVGNSAMFTNLTGNSNSAFGYGALYSNLDHNNSAFGYSAMRLNSNGQSNSAFGTFALEYQTTGYYNTAIGIYALNTTTSGNRNTAIGSYAGQSLGNTVEDNTAVGYEALRGAQSNKNTATGSYSQNQTSSGANNASFGDHSLFHNTTGGNNTAIGTSAGLNNITGSNNTYLGYNIFCAGNNYNNSTTIGANTTPNASNKVRIGDAAVTVCEVPVAWTVSSDKNLKDQVKYDVPGLELINKLQPATYVYKAHGENATRYTGLLAQDVEATLQSLGINSSIVTKPNEDGSGSWGIRYSELTLPLIKAVQEQQTMIENQEKLIAEQMKLLQELKQEVEILKQK